MLDELTSEVLQHLPHSRAIETRPADQQLIYLHCHTGSWHWWIAGFDQRKTFLCFAFLGNEMDAEWGYITLPELYSLGARVEVFNPARLFSTIRWRLSNV